MCENVVVKNERNGETFPRRLNGVK